jgi:mono/diheme cytochrome c family protein
VTTCALAWGAPPDKSGPSAGDLQFFEQRVRPILVEYCHSCHGPKKQELGLRLDSAEGLRKGSESGPVVVPGAPDDSLLIQAVRYNGDTQMPPKGKLPDEAIAALVTWVKAGAAWPVDPNAVGSDTATPAERAKTHWAFQPVGDPAIPDVQDPAWVATPVDAFVLARLEQAGLPPSPRADRRTLVRRATFDLHGLPPSPAEVAAFEADSSPDAFRMVVQRLLASPRYGERWGRHWLDVARYADTKGYVRLNENPNYPCSWTYRDYVIRAFNEDLPYDRLILEQLAADQLDLGDDPRPLAALGFLTLGQRFINSQHDIIDDRIDVVTRGLLGLTVTCARCHDHKFDPIPTRDYYSLHGVFASSLEPRVPPLILRESEKLSYEAYLAELAQRQMKLDEFLRMQQAALTSACRTRVAEYLLAGQSEPVQANFLAVMFLVNADHDLNPVMTQRWARFLEQTRKRHHPVFAPWNDLAQLAAEEFAQKLAALLAEWQSRTDGDRRINQVVVEALARHTPGSLVEVATTYAALLQEADERWRQIVQEDASATESGDRDWEELRQASSGPESPLMIALTEVDDFLFVDTTKQNELHAHQRLVEDWVGTPGAAPHAMALVDSQAPADSHIFVRGNASNPGDLAPRMFLSVLTQGDGEPFRNGSGRLELAQAITSPDNPLTVRVLVNRVWQHHFGQGLVRTPGDFGLRGEPPTHPELLDYLARRFIAEGWSIKSLHEWIMLSSTYQQQSLDAPAGRARDPENKLLWKMNRQRLDWEALRDSLLAVSGGLDLTPGGPGVNLFQPPFSARRSVYGFIDRQSLPGTMRMFDFVPPDATAPQRHQTTVPQQALFLMNNPFLKEQARRLTARTEVTACATTPARVDAVHRLLFGRPARENEHVLAERYFSAESAATGDDASYLSRWEEYVQVLLLSNEFVFVD